MKRIIALLVFVVLVAALWTGAWLFVATQIDQQVKLYAAPSTPGQPQITCGDFSTTGFPFRFDVTCTDMVVNDGDMTLALPELKVTALVYRPTHFIAFAQGPLTYSDAFLPAERQVSWKSLEASLRMDGWQLARLSIVGSDMALANTLFGNSLIASATDIELHALGTPSTSETANNTITLGLFARVENAQVPVFAASQTALVAEADVSQMPADIRNWQDPDLLRLWQTVGGALKLHRFEITQPDASVALDGDLKLNEIGEAEGDFSLVSTNVGPRLDVFLAPEIRDIFLGRPQADGSHKQVFTIRRGAVFAGLTPVGTMEPLF